MAWVSAGDPEATDLSGLSAKSGASADSDDDDGAARSPLRPLPTRTLPPLSVLQAADGPLGARTAEPGAYPRGFTLGFLLYIPSVSWNVLQAELECVTS